MIDSNRLDQKGGLGPRFRHGTILAPGISPRRRPVPIKSDAQAIAYIDWGVSLLILLRFPPGYIEDHDAKVEILSS